MEQIVERAQFARCRTCMEISYNLISLKEQVFPDKTDVLVSTIVEFFFNEPIANKQNLKICGKCFEEAKTAYAFSIKCNKTKELLKNFRSDSIMKPYTDIKNEEFRSNRIDKIENVSVIVKVEVSDDEIIENLLSDEEEASKSEDISVNTSVVDSEGTVSTIEREIQPVPNQQSNQMVIAEVFKLMVNSKRFKNNEEINEDQSLRVDATKAKDILVKTSDVCSEATGSTIAQEIAPVLNLASNQVVIADAATTKPKSNRIRNNSSFNEEINEDQSLRVDATKSKDILVKTSDVCSEATGSTIAQEIAPVFNEPTPKRKSNRIRNNKEINEEQLLRVDARKPKDILMKTSDVCSEATGSTIAQEIAPVLNLASNQVVIADAATTKPKSNRIRNNSSFNEEINEDQSLRVDATKAKDILVKTLDVCSEATGSTIAQEIAPVFNEPTPKRKSNRIRNNKEINEDQLLRVDARKPKDILVKTSDVCSEATGSTIAQEIAPVLNLASNQVVIVDAPTTKPKSNRIRNNKEINEDQLLRVDARKPKDILVKTSDVCSEATGSTIAQEIAPVLNLASNQVVIADAATTKPKSKRIRNNKEINKAQLLRVDARKPKDVSVKTLDVCSEATGSTIAQEIAPVLNLASNQMVIAIPKSNRIRNNEEINEDQSLKMDATKPKDILVKTSDVCSEATGSTVAQEIVPVLNLASNQVVIADAATAIRKSNRIRNKNWNRYEFVQPETSKRVKRKRLEKTVERTPTKMVKLPNEVENNMDVEMFACKFCEKTFESDVEYAEHCVVHNTQICYLKSKKFQRFPTDKRYLVCTICDNVFYHRKNLSRHKKNAHEICKLCGMLPMNRKELKKHIETTHLRAGKCCVQRCPFCNETFQKFDELKKHVKMELCRS